MELPVLSSLARARKKIASLRLGRLAMTHSLLLVWVCSPGTVFLRPGLWTLYLRRPVLRRSGLLTLLLPVTKLVLVLLRLDGAPWLDRRSGSGLGMRPALGIALVLRRTRNIRPR